MVNFSETISASDLKVGRSRHLIEFMKVSIEGQCHSKVVYIQKSILNFLRNYCAILNRFCKKAFRYKKMKI